MPKSDVIHRRLLATLAEQQFAQRYYALYELLRQNPASEAATPPVKPEQLIEQQFGRVAYFAKEHFHRYAQPLGTHELWLHIDARGQQVEFGLYLMQANIYAAGGPFHRLARELSQTTEETSASLPRFPRLPYVDDASLEQVLAFAKQVTQNVTAAVQRDPAFFLHDDGGI